MTLRNWWRTIRARRAARAAGKPLCRECFKAQLHTSSTKMCHTAEWCPVLIYRALLLSATTAENQRMVRDCSRPMLEAIRDMGAQLANEGVTAVSYTHLTLPTM
jgi:hypothetical protein